MVRPRLDGWYRFGRWLSRVFIPTFGTIEVVGRENIPKHGPLIVAPNHQSNADPPVLVYAIERPLYFMAKRTLFANAVVAYLLRSVHVYPIDRDNRDVGGVRWALGQLKTDHALVVFPEGTRSREGLRRGTAGLAYLAGKSGATILPVAITGTEKIEGMFRIAFHFRSLKVVIGEPFTPRAVTGGMNRSELQAITDEVMGRVARLLPAEYRGVYGHTYAD